jgi:hypothetical protein
MVRFPSPGRFTKPGSVRLRTLAHGRHLRIPALLAGMPCFYRQESEGIRRAIAEAGREWGEIRGPELPVKQISRRVLSRASVSPPPRSRHRAATAPDESAAPARCTARLHCISNWIRAPRHPHDGSALVHPHPGPLPARAHAHASHASDKFRTCSSPVRRSSPPWTTPQPARPAGLPARRWQSLSALCPNLSHPVHPEK